MLISIELLKAILYLKHAIKTVQFNLKDEKIRVHDSNRSNENNLYFK